MDTAFITKIEAFDERGPSTSARLVFQLSKPKNWQRKSKAAVLKPVTGIGYALDGLLEKC